MLFPRSLYNTIYNSSRPILDIIKICHAGLFHDNLLLQTGTCTSYIKTVEFTVAL